MLFAFTIAKHVKSNAIVYAKAGQTAGRRRRPDEPQGFSPHRRPARRRLRPGPEGLGLRVRSLLPVPRRPDPGGRRRLHRGDPARRLDRRRRRSSTPPTSAAWPWSSPACGCSGTRMARRGLALGLIAALVASPVLAAPYLAERLLGVDRATAWTPAGAIPVQFPTFHPQGMVRIGYDFFVSSVEVKRAPAPDPKQPGGPTPAQASATCSSLGRRGATGRSGPRRGRRLSPRRDRLRRPLYLVPGGRVPTRQPRGSLPCRLSKHDRHHGAARGRPHRRGGPRSAERQAVWRLWAPAVL